MATSSLAAVTPCALCGGSALVPDVQAGYHCVDDRNKEMGNSNGMWDGSGYGLATEEACTASFGVWAAYTCKFVSDQYTFLDTADYACSSAQIMCALIASLFLTLHSTTSCAWSQLVPVSTDEQCGWLLREADLRPLSAPSAAATPAASAARVTTRLHRRRRACRGPQPQQ